MNVLNTFSVSRLLPLLLFACLFASCTGTKKISALVDQRTAIPRTTSSYVSVEASPQVVDSRVEKRSGKFLPALFYWNWSNDIHIGLGDDYLTETFHQALARRVDSLVTIGYLPEADYDFTIRDFPNDFSYRNDGQVIYFLIAYTATVSESIAPLTNNVLIEYDVRRSDEVIASGQLRYDELLQPAGNYVHSTQRFVGDYFNYLEQTIDQVAHALVRELGTLDMR